MEAEDQFDLLMCSTVKKKRFKITQIKSSNRISIPTGISTLLVFVVILCFYGEK